MAGIAVVDSDDSTLWKFSSGREGEIISRICAALMATVDELPGNSGGAGGGAGVGAAAACSVKLGDGVFLRMESVSMSRPVVKTSSSIDVASNLDASCSVAST